MYYSTSTNFAQYDFFPVPKIVLSGDPLYMKLFVVKFWDTATWKLRELKSDLLTSFDLNDLERSH